MYFQIFHIVNIIFYCLWGVCFLLLLFNIVMHLTAILPAKKFTDAKKEHKYAILVPARNESKVIAGLLDSIKAQSYPADKLDTFVIVESEDDPTCEIVKAYPRTHVIVRKHLELKGKGYALDEALQEILAREHDYEAYFVFDADNILDKDYFAEMNKTFDAGYDMGLGFRDAKNWNDNWISSCSAITFMIITLFKNKPRSKLGLSIHICGTGFYISGRVIEKLGGWKFFSLTEDYELSLYASLNNLSNSYNEKAKFYDEQPTKFKQSWAQRIRWCKGYSQANKIYKAKLLKSGLTDKDNNKRQRIDKISYGIGVLPLVITVAVILIYQIFNLVYFIVGLSIGNPLWIKSLWAFLAATLAQYVFLAVYTAIILIALRKKINIRFWKGVECVLTNPFFMLSYFGIYMKSLTTKEVVWVPINHGENKSK